eukprot:CAMPEP_0172497098 /NCGR_PEP_ID=MMETSP1066-20121228/95156_1 /TAXON_ID=671091 /ORGANISM="Coscinodiscus wailesii, Strain CCMP2513" /LENGTH=315 /DNA_ID=CAMNT_0013269691 /DNA_START=141 /DNA_END=1088 /DNA_ORIENTATION=+
MMLNSATTPRLSMRYGGASVSFLNDENAMNGASARNRKKLGGGGGFDHENHNNFSCSKAKNAPFKKTSIVGFKSSKDAGVNFTPRQQTGRRVFGDISNRKGPRDRNGNNGGAILPNKTNVIGKAVSFHGAVKNTKTPGRKSSFVPFSASKVSSSSKQLSALEGSRKTKKECVIPRKIDNISSLKELSLNNNSTNARGTERRCNGVKEVVTKLTPAVAPVDDIEFPAGRMWHEQSDPEDDFNFSFESDTDSFDFTDKQLDDTQTAFNDEMKELERVDLEAQGLMDVDVCIYAFDDLSEDDIPASWGEPYIDGDISL